MLANFQMRKEILARALARLGKLIDNLEVIDRRTAFLRLVATIAILSGLVSIWRELEATHQLAASFSFVLAFLVASWVHSKLQSKISFLKGLRASLTASESRLTMNHKQLAHSFSPWHKAVAASVSEGHLYSNDLDVHTHFFDFVDTCTTRDGSRRLFEWLTGDGLVPPEATVRNERARRAKVLSRATPVLRRMESTRLDESRVGEAMREIEKEKEIEAGKFRFEVSTLINVLYWAFGVFSIALWIKILLPGYAQVVETGSSEALFAALSAYAWVPVLGLFIYYPLVRAASAMKPEIGRIDFLLTMMSKFSDAHEFAQFTSLQADAPRLSKRLSRAVDLVSVRGNPLLWLVFHILLPFDSMVCLYLLGAYKKVAPKLSEWAIEAAEFDALCALARFASENPCANFIESDERLDPNAIEVEELGHPLIALDKSVANDLTLTARERLVLLTGSNMAGKSTFLRALGLNLLLFNMGGPVVARKFRSRPMKILCAIRIDDSLEEATSYFYAEVKRLRLILEELEKSKKEGSGAFFLVDEIFRGTNNKERFFGSWHYIRALLQTERAGLVSTHDLALTELQNKEAGLRNMHFRDHVEGSQFLFDYKLRLGPCPTTNALRIMRSEGLPIPMEQP